jgi:hypothetical protein
MRFDADASAPEVPWNLRGCSRVDDDVRIVNADNRLDGSHPSFDEWYVTAWPEAFRLAAYLTHDTQAGEDIASRRCHRRREG